MQPEVNPKNLGVKMLRRDFGKVALRAIASSALLRSAKGANITPAAEFPKTPGLTDYVGRFVVSTKYEDIPADVIELGKKSILDGLGLALAGSKAETGGLCRQYVEKLGVSGGQATIAGSRWNARLRKRFRLATIRRASIPPERADRSVRRRRAPSFCISIERRF